MPARGQGGYRYFYFLSNVNTKGPESLVKKDGLQPLEQCWGEGGMVDNKLSF